MALYYEVSVVDRTPKTSPLHYNWVFCGKNMIRALIEVKSLKKQCNASETITARRVSGHLCFNDRLLQKKYDNFVSSLRKDIQLAVRDGKKLYTVEVNCRIFFENKEDDLKVISNLVEEAWGDLPIMVIIDS